MMILGNATKQTSLNPTTSDGKDKKVHSQVARQLVDIEILYLLNFGAKSGYELRKSLSKSFGIKISYGTLYPHLHALERSDLIAGTWSQKEESSPPASLKKRVYDLTSHGMAVLKESIERLGSISMTMQFLLNKVDLGQKSRSQSESRETLISSLQSILSCHGHQLERMCVERGSSGVEHPVELLARNKAGSKTMIRIVESDDKFDLEQALKTLVISNDIQARAFLLACPPLSKEVSDLCRFYHMQLFEGGDWQKVLEDYKVGLNESESLLSQS